MTQDWVREKDDLQEDSEAETEEEALSLCDLPLDGDCVKKSDSKKDDLQPSSDQELFEFLTDLKTETTRSAEDIIFCGKLLPYRSPPLSNLSPKTSKCVQHQTFDFPPNKFPHRKSESLNDLRRSQSTAKSRLMRSNNSLDYRKLHRDSSPKMTRTEFLAPPNDRISAGKCFGNARRVPVSATPAKPKWRLLMFGFMKAPEMELKDIRNRQSRLIPSTFLPGYYSEEMDTMKKDEGKGTWKLLRAFSCKGQANGVITASFSCIPRV